MASADSVIGNQLFVEPSRTARASSSHSSPKSSRWGCLPRQPGRVSFPAFPQAGGVVVGGGFGAVDEILPCEVVERAGAAGQEETLRNGVGILRRLVALGA